MAVPCETSATGTRTKVPSIERQDRGAEVVGYGEGFPPLQPIMGSGERRELPLWGLWHSPGRQHILVYYRATEHFW